MQAMGLDDRLRRPDMSIRTMLCSDCMKPFNVLCRTWKGAEKAACPWCGSHETTPIFVKEV
jgi:DNA-directed RNA polymerase subunit RPC12/RpoP